MATEQEAQEVAEAIADVPVTVIDADYPWVESPDEARRTFILELMASPEIDGYILVENLAAIEAWVKAGAVAKRPKEKHKLKVVE